MTQLDSTKLPPTKVAVCQITSTNDVQYNLKISCDVARRAAAAGAKAIFLPEAADFISPTQHECYILSQPLATHTYALGLQSLAKELGVWICAGIHEIPRDDEVEDLEESRKGEKVLNSHVAIGPDGMVKGCYRKLHLFDIQLKEESQSIDSSKPPIKKGGESDRILPGRQIPQIIDFGMSIGNVGLEICYDIRFPELHTILTRLGSKTLLIPSAFTLKTGKDHWYTLCRATAIQYQCYVLCATQAGAHNPTRTSWGEALAFDPWGKELGRLRSVDDFERDGGDREGVMPGEFILCEVDEGLVDSVRDQIPLAIQKRSDVYGVVGK